MRFLAAFLLLANLGLFAWIYTQPTPLPPVHRVAPIPSGVTPLVLLSERSDSAPTTTIAAEPSPAEIPIIEETVAEPLAKALSAKRICQTIGPVMKSKDAKQIVQRLETQGYEVRQRKNKVRQPSGYKVYLPAMPATEARQIVAALDANGMKDHFIGRKNYISLGIFRSEDQAKIRFKQVRALGYEPILDQHYRNRTVHWLDVEEAGQPLLISPVWQKLQAQYPDIQIQGTSCE